MPLVEATFSEQIDPGTVTPDAAGLVADTTIDADLYGHGFKWPDPSVSRYRMELDFRNGHLRVRTGDAESCESCGVFPGHGYYFHFLLYPVAA